MPVLSVNPRQDTQPVEWARLIPGEVPEFRRSGKKPVQAVRPFPLERVSDRPQSSRLRGKQSRALATAAATNPGGPEVADIGGCGLRAGSTQLAAGRGGAGSDAHALPACANVWLRGGVPISLLGLACLHAALITLVGYTEEPNPADFGLPAQTRVLAKSVIWGTAVLCVAFSLQGAPWTMCGLFCVAGVLHFGTLWIRRWRTQQPDRLVQRCFDSASERPDCGSGRSGTARSCLCRPTSRRGTENLWLSR